LLLRPYHSNRRAIPHQVTKFRPNLATRCGVMTSYTISRWRQRQLNTSGFVFDDATLFRRSNLSANQIWSTRLNPRLRYNYFRFGKTNVRHIGILLPFAILTRSQSSACYSTSNYQMSPQHRVTCRRVMTWYAISR